MIPGRPEAAEPPHLVALEPRRYRVLNVVSILLILAGLLLVVAVLREAGALLDDGARAPIGAERAVEILLLAVAGTAALMVGLVASAVRSIVVRETLPAHRYRGPSIIVLYLLANLAANLISLPVAGEIASVTGGDDPSLYGSIVLLTATQAGLLSLATLFVVAPRALAGLRLLPRGGIARSVGIGLLLVVPSWIGAQLIGYLTQRALEPFGMEPETGIAELALSSVDPVLLVVALVIVAPVAEEIFFRGVVYNAWEREYGATRALVGSAVLFAIIHGSIFFIPAILALGLVLGLVYRSTRSLPAVIALHAGFNGITVLIGLLVRYGVLDSGLT